MATTIEDIARETGVSRATVSLVLRHSPEVASRTRERVEAAIARLGYRRNQLAASLRSKRSYILGLVVNDLTYPHYAQTAVGVEEAVEGGGYSLIVANSHDAVERELQHVENLRRYRADGLIISPVLLGDDGAAQLAALRAADYPVVSLYRELPGLDADYCGWDVYVAMRTLVAYLAGELGHRRIAVFTTGRHNATNPARLAGWREELRTRGLPAGDDLVFVSTAPRAHGGETAAHEFLTRGVRHAAATAVVCVQDLLAIGAMRAFHRAGVLVPEDVSIAGMDGYEDSSPPDKPLTTMAVDFREVGRQAGRLLLQRIEQRQAEGDRSTRAPTKHPRVAGTTASPERRLVPARLIIGGTTGPHPGR